jgi:ribosomal protein S6--L-glutamate ligase
MAKIKNKIIVGSEEWCSFPELGIPAIKARVDSGAKTSSIHAFNIHRFRRNSESWVSFEVHPLQKNRQTVIRCERPLLDKRTVKSSTGVAETRYVISAMISAGGDSWDIELTLANRDSMGYRMLLGREAMNGRMLVDPSLSYCLGKYSALTLKNYYGTEKRKQSGLKIGLLASDLDLYSNQRILEAGSERGHEMVFINIKQCYMNIDAKAPEAHYRGGKVLSNLDAVITRIRPSMTTFGCALSRQFENMGVYTVNASTAIAQSRDKLFSLQKLNKSNVAIPATSFANSPMDTNDLIEMVGDAPLVVKLLEGTQGHGAILAETNKAAESVINSFKTFGASLLVQEFIKEAGGKDLRCFVIDGKIIAAIQREAAPGEFRANIQQGGSASIAKVTAKEKAMAIKAADIFGLKVAGVDIIRSERGPLLLEVNPSPGLEGIETATGKDIAGMMIVSVEKQLGWKRALASIK